MYPAIALSILGLNQNESYCMKLVLIPEDEHRFRFQNSKWMPLIRCKELKERSYECEHPHSPKSGKYWMQCGIDFSSIKLSNNKHATSINQVKITCENIKLLHFYYSIIVCRSLPPPPPPPPPPFFFDNYNGGA